LASEDLIYSAQVIWTTYMIVLCPSPQKNKLSCPVSHYNVLILRAFARAYQLIINKLLACNIAGML